MHIETKHGRNSCFRRMGYDIKIKGKISISNFPQKEWYWRKIEVWRFFTTIMDARKRYGQEIQLFAVR